MSNDNPQSRRINRLDAVERTQLAIARRTLRMHPAIANVMGGPTQDEARKIIQQLTQRGR